MRPRIPHPLTVVHLNEANTASNIYLLSVRPQVGGHVHPLVQRMAVGKVDKVKEVMNVVNLPDHLGFALVVGSGSTQRQGELGGVIEERESNRFRGGDDIDRLWFIGDLEPENLIFGTAILGQELHRIDLCKKKKKVEYMRH